MQVCLGVSGYGCGLSATPLPGCSVYTELIIPREWWKNPKSKEQLSSTPGRGLQKERAEHTIVIIRFNFTDASMVSVQINKNESVQINKTVEDVR